LNHYASPEFWYHYRALPAEIRNLADRCFELLKDNPRHPSLHLKRVGEFWSARVGLHYRALGIDDEGGISWFWIGTHAEYDDLVG
jgi:hypothetical protein